MRTSSATHPRPQLQPKPDVPSEKRERTSSQEMIGAGVSRLVRHAGSPPNQVDGGVSPRGTSTMSATDTATHVRSLPKEEAGVIRKLGNWIADSVAGLFVGAAARQLGEVMRTAWQGVRDLAVGAAEFVVNASVLVLGAGISAVQTALGLEAPGRSVNARERELLGRVFGAGLDLDKVVIKEGFSGVGSLSERPFALGNTLYLKRYTLPPDATPAEERRYLATLAHEAVHAWQHQHGNTPIAESLWNDRVLGDAYDWRRGFAEQLGFHELNVEQQAQLIQDAVLAGYFDDPPPRFDVAGVDYTCDLEQALRQLRRAD